jgi:hypothetical protein
VHPFLRRRISQNSRARRTPSCDVKCKRCNSQTARPLPAAAPNSLRGEMVPGSFRLISGRERPSEHHSLPRPPPIDISSGRRSPITWVIVPQTIARSLAQCPCVAGLSSSYILRRREDRTNFGMTTIARFECRSTGKTGEGIYRHPARPGCDNWSAAVRIGKAPHRLTWFRRRFSPRQRSLSNISASRWRAH